MHALLRNEVASIKVAGAEIIPYGEIWRNLAAKNLARLGFYGCKGECH
jgi:hypothetical protein